MEAATAGGTRARTWWWSSWGKAALTQRGAEVGYLHTELIALLGVGHGARELLGSELRDVARRLLATGLDGCPAVVAEQAEALHAMRTLISDLRPSPRRRAELKARLDLIAALSSWPAARSRPRGLAGMSDTPDNPETNRRLSEMTPQARADSEARRAEFAQHGAREERRTSWASAARSTAPGTRYWRSPAPRPGRPPTLSG